MDGRGEENVKPKGRVLADSERNPEQLARMDNHLGRPEVREAFTEGVGSAIRHSDTIDIEIYEHWLEPA